MATDKYPKDWDRKYTDPALRLRLKDEVVAGDKGGKAGQWSARKAQLLKHEYEKAGGGYRGEKDEQQQHLSSWTDEDWQTSDGSDRARTDAEDEKGGAAKRYLPKKAWEELSEEEKQATNAAKAEGSKQGEQFVANPDAARKAGRKARGDGAGPDLPIAGYADLSAKEAVKAVGRLEDAQDVRAIRDYERGHAHRKTVLERVDRLLD